MSAFHFAKSVNSPKQVSLRQKSVTSTKKASLCLNKCINQTSYHLKRHTFLAKWPFLWRSDPFFGEVTHFQRLIRRLALKLTLIWRIDPFSNLFYFYTSSHVIFLYDLSSIDDLFIYKVKTGIIWMTHFIRYFLSANIILL